MKVNGKDYPTYYFMEKKQCSKPPTRIYLGPTFVFGLVPETSLEAFPTENTTCKTTNFWVITHLLAEDVAS